MVHTTGSSCVALRAIADGKSGFTQELLQAFLQNNIQRYTISFDNDETDPEDRCAKKVATKLQAAGIECLRIHYPHNANDTNACAMKLKDGNGSVLH